MHLLDNFVSLLFGPLLDFFKMWHVPVFHSAGHINFVVRLLLACLPYIQENPEAVVGNVFFYLLECSNSEPLHSAQVCTKAEARPLTSIDFC